MIRPPSIEHPRFLDPDLRAMAGPDLRDLVMEMRMEERRLREDVRAADEQVRDWRWLAGFALAAGAALGVAGWWSR